MSLAAGLILMCAIISLGGICLVWFALWILSNDSEAEAGNIKKDRPPNH